MMNKIRNWLVEEGIYKDKVADDGATYHFLAEVPPGSQQIIDVIQPKPREDLVVLVSGVQLSEEHYKSLKAMPKTKREEILWDIRFSLLFLESGFQIIPGVDDPKIFQFTRELYFDGLTKIIFMDAIKQIYRCKLFIIWKMLQLFGEAPPSTSQEPMYR